MPTVIELAQQQETCNRSYKVKKLGQLWDEIMSDIDQYKRMLKFPFENKHGELTRLSKKIDSQIAEYGLTCV